MAVTREGIPVRMWTFPGTTSDQKIIRKVKDEAIIALAMLSIGGHRPTLPAR